MDDIRSGRSHAGCRHSRLAAVLWWHWNLFWPVGVGPPCHSNHGERSDSHHPIKVRKPTHRADCVSACRCVPVRVCLCPRVCLRGSAR